MREADERFLERLAAEVEALVRGWGRLTGARLDDGGSRVLIILAIETPSGPVEVRCDGATMIEAAATVAVRVSEARLERAFRALVLAPRA